MTAATIERRAALIENVEFLLDWGESWAEVARRLGARPDSLARQLHRLGRHDLARRFGSVGTATTLNHCPRSAHAAP